MMRRRMKSACVLSFFSLALLSRMSLLATPAVIDCHEPERQALLELKQRIVDPSHGLSSWVGEDCCAWQGIECNNITARIIKLDLGNDINNPSSFLLYSEWEVLQLRGDINTPSMRSLEQLTHLDLNDNAFIGPFPAFLESFAKLKYLDLSGNSFTGPIPAFLESFAKLKYLDLSGNSFTGPIPAFLGSFSKLTYLDLSGGRFTGKVPDQLGNLSALQYLDLSNNYNFEDLNDNLYIENPGWIARLASLRHLNMSQVSFRRTSSWFEALNTLPHIQDVQLGWCDLEAFPSSPPHLNFTSLRTLNFRGNHINSTEPMWVYNITTLEYLYFGWNDIYWSAMHYSITRLASLKALDLSGNKISNSFLLQLSNLCKLQILGLSQMTIEDELSSLEMLFSACLMYSLEALYLDSNQLNGSLFNWLGNMKNLRIIDLANNALHGSILNSLGNLTSLQYLDLSYNNLNETYNLLHGSVLNSLGSLTLLQYLDMSHNNLNDTYNSLNGSILNSLGSLTSLQYLDLSYNNLIGTYNSLHGSILNSLGSLTSLQYLDLSYNNLNETYNSLHGSILNSLGNLTSLQRLYLRYNNLNETIGESIGQLKNLISLGLSRNSLSLPLIHLANLSSLKHLGISNNFLFINETVDWIPTFQLQALYMSSCKIEQRLGFPKWLQSQKNLKYLNLDNVGIEGSFPTFLPSSLEVLYLSNNSFSSHLPPNIGNILPNIRYLDLQLNNFNGSIPHSLCQMHNLKLLQLSKNNFSGELPNCWNGSSVAFKFDLSNNLFHGEIPHTFCNLQSIQSLSLSYNHLSGRIPLCLQNCRKLIILDVGYNNFTGNIPTWSKQSLPLLISLSLNSNFLTGNIPELSHLACLQTLDLSNNHLSGSIPKSFGNFNTLKSSPKDTKNMYSTNFAIVIWLRVKGIEYEYESLYGLVKSIDLSNNDLSGYIPEELGKLHGLQHLNLSKNNLIREIPWSINGMQYLEGFYLSRNSLSGKIPSTLAYLNFLGNLNVSYNNLSGCIPTSTQLQSFDPSTYIGNPYLCGPPLTKGCTCDIVKGSSEIENKDVDGRKETIWLFTSIALGFIIGLWGIWSTLLLHKRWRNFYFRVIDNTFSMLYMKTLLKIRRKIS